ncbi:hypothetical protein NDU88_005842 [Pleurodeles waltl]|uniref:Uncharacterized protein n=1 Tax=Pleurodeles waltl TaxID=8319 RepID=A0AAV7TBR1_PLEWA|nr:hypothetical protein NDU88_005842 [Pleurodeles waltl]
MIRTLQGLTMMQCDGPALLGPSVKATCAVAAVSTRELKDGAANPLELPESKGQPGLTRTPENTEKGKRADGERGAEEAGVWKNEEGRPTRLPAKSKDTSGGGNQKKSARRYLQHRWRRTAKLPATLREKRGTLRCVLKLA